MNASATRLQMPRVRSSYLVTFHGMLVSYLPLRGNSLRCVVFLGGLLLAACAVGACEGSRADTFLKVDTSRPGGGPCIIGTAASCTEVASGKPIGGQR